MTIILFFSCECCIFQVFYYWLLSFESPSSVRLILHVRLFSWKGDWMILLFSGGQGNMHITARPLPESLFPSNVRLVDGQAISASVSSFWYVHYSFLPSLIFLHFTSYLSPKTPLSTSTTTTTCKCMILDS